MMEGDADSVLRCEPAAARCRTDTCIRPTLPHAADPVTFNSSADCRSDPSSESRKFASSNPYVSNTCRHVHEVVFDCLFRITGHHLRSLREPGLSTPLPFRPQARQEMTTRVRQPCCQTDKRRKPTLRRSGRPPWFGPQNFDIPIILSPPRAGFRPEGNRAAQLSFI